ncbi:MAG: glycosyltransferase family 4 protein [Limnobacter sp.]|nr:glycosyltransferase family 4 protein [Limnobacter sp.]
MTSYRILIVANHVPFIKGGAEAHVEGLVSALRAEGHEVDVLRLPFKFEDRAYLEQLMNFVEGMDLQNFNGYRVDRVISLLFPGFAAQHPSHVSWVIHQHRAVYDLYKPEMASDDLRYLKEKITAFDQNAFSSKQAVFANSGNVAKRLLKYTGVDSKPLYHPPPGAGNFYCADVALPYVFFPSRIEVLKRQDLLLKAAQLMKSDLKIILSGSGSQAHVLHSEIEALQLQGKVRFVGSLSEEEKHAFYAKSSAVFFGPYDEDLGYVTLEAMLSSKPVITCTDSGGPLEFVEHQVNGWVVNPDPQCIADVLDQIAANPTLARDYGRAARQRYNELDISWSNVVKSLLAGAEVLR